jgi:hypothetical protein
MLDDAIRIGFLVLVGLALAVTIAWYVAFVVQEIRSGGQIVIDQFTVIREDGSGNASDGMALAQMLQVRLQTLVAELRDAQAGLTADASLTALPGVLPYGDVRLLTAPVELQATLLQPVEMKLSVAGVEVGGLLPWIQRRLTSRRTLHFTAYLQGGTAEISGSVSAMGLSDEGVRLSIAGDGSKPPSFAVIVDQLAHEILRRYLAQGPSNQLALLDPDEFASLSDVLVGTAEANRKAVRGRLVPEAFARFLPQITALADRVPNWPELGYLAARIADSAKDSAKALAYYQRVLPQFKSANDAKLVESIEARIVLLTPPAAEPVKAVAFTTGPLPASVDYTADIKLVRDNGAEGSVVGQALATAMEYQIAKATGAERRISARYIYYAARKAGGLDLASDTGAQLGDAVAALSTKGAVEDSVWPYRPGEFAANPPPAVETAPRFRIADAKQLSGLDAVKRALAENGPVVAGISVYHEMMSDKTAKTGVVPMPAKSSTVMGGHAIVIVGYDDEKQRVKFVNSWGKDWGDHGFGYLPYEYIERYMSDAWTFKFAAA